MFNHYLTTALRHFRRHKFTTALNVLCLSLGLGCFIGAHALVTLLQSSDRQFPDADRIYALTQRMIAPGGNMSIPTSPTTAWPAGEYLKTDFPELEASARLMASVQAPLSTPSIKTFAGLSYADPQFFKVFAWPFLAGDSQTALSTTRTAVLTQEFATRLFGDPKSALGKTVLAYGGLELTVTGVLAPLRGLSHMSEIAQLGHFDMLVPMQVFAASPDGQVMSKIWNTPRTFTYLLLPRDGSLTPTALRERLKGFAARHVPAYEWKSEFGAVPVSGLLIAWLNAVIGTDQSGLSAVFWLHVLGAVVLLAACLNYANLATAQASLRGREVGLRRVVGAYRGQLALQYFAEALLLASIAAPLALLVIAGGASILSSATVLVDGVAQLLLSQLPLALMLVVAVGLVAGAYPALVLSRVSTIHALRSGQLRSGPRFVPSMLAGLQFAGTSFMIIVILVMSAQHRSLERMALSRLEDPVVVLANDLATSGVKFETLRAELLNKPHVISVSASMLPPWSIAGALIPVSASAAVDARRATICNNPVERDYLRTMNLKLIAGRDFDASRANDSGDFLGLLGRGSARWREGTAAVIDRSLAEQNGWTAQQAIGKRLYLWAASAAGTARPVEVIGVVETKAQRLIGMGATANIYLMTPGAANVPLVRLSSSDLRAGLAEIDAAWERLAPNIAVKRQFADEVLNGALRIFLFIGSVFQAIAALSLVIAVLGLIGMSMHVIGRRTHEIGVRKTLGASARQVLTLLLRDFSRPVLIANVAMWPLAFVVMQVYLSIFAQRVGLGIAPFAASLLITLCIAWLAVIMQATRAARLKPANVLRYE